MSYCTVCHQDHYGTVCPSRVPEIQKTLFKCPVCDGQGTVSRPPHIAGDVDHWSSASLEFYDCPACDSTGIVWG